jgi:hypothetical protein
MSAYKGTAHEWIDRVVSQAEKASRDAAATQAIDAANSRVNEMTARALWCAIDDFLSDDWATTRELVAVHKRFAGRFRR